MTEPGESEEELSFNSGNDTEQGKEATEGGDLFQNLSLSHLTSLTRTVPDSHGYEADYPC